MSLSAIHSTRNTAPRQEYHLCHSLAAALDYASRYGWPVFPLRGKVPAIRHGHGHHDATTDPEGIRELWRKAPKADGIGVNLEAAGLVVLDWDCTEPELTCLTARLDLPPTATARTPSRGRHYLYALPTEAEARRIIRHAGQPLDILAKGYAALPPGPGRDWIRDAPPTVAPTWVVSALAPKPHSPHRPSTAPVCRAPGPLLATVAGTVAGTPEGQREYVLYGSAKYLARRGIDAAAARQALLQACDANGYNADTGHHFERTFANAWRDGLADPVPEPLAHATTVDADAVRRLIRTPEVRREWGQGYQSARVVIDALLDWAAGRPAMNPGNGWLSIATGLSAMTVGRALKRASQPLECLGGRPILVRVAAPECSKRRWKATRWQLDITLRQSVTTVTLGDSTSTVTLCRKGSPTLLSGPPPAECDAAVHPMAARALDPDGGPLSAIGQAGADVLAALAELGSGSAAAVATAAGVSTRTAQRHLAKALAVGYLSVDHEPTPGRPLPVYRLSVEATEALGIGGPVCRALKAKRRAFVCAARAATRAYLARGGDPEADAARAERACRQPYHSPQLTVLTPTEVDAKLAAACITTSAGRNGKLWYSVAPLYG